MTSKCQGCHEEMPPHLLGNDGRTLCGGCIFRIGIASMSAEEKARHLAELSELFGEPFFRDPTRYAMHLNCKVQEITGESPREVLGNPSAKR